MTNLYFVRHGKTEWNLEARYQGAHGDSPLLDQSYDEIKQLGRFLAGTQFAHVYASPIKRARLTAFELVKSIQQAVPLTLMSQLSEFGLGKMEGMLFDDVKQQFPSEYDAFRHHPEAYDPTSIDGESFPQLIDRMGRAIKEIAAVNQGNDINVLIVSHGAALNAVINALLGVPLAHLRDRGGLSNTSTTILQTQLGREFKLIKWNDTSYLKKTISDPTDTI